MSLSHPRSLHVSSHYLCIHLPLNIHHLAAILHAFIPPSNHYDHRRYIRQILHHNDVLDSAEVHGGICIAIHIVENWFGKAHLGISWFPMNLN